jgi:hypothetical protein
MKYKKLSLLGAVLDLIFATAASAHAPYILPFQFNTDKDVTTLHAAWTDTFFEPEFPGGGAEGGYDITVTNPSGKTSHAEYISRHKQLTLIEVDTKEAGTYKIERVLTSPLFSQVLRDGKAIGVRNGGTPEERKAMEAKKIKNGELQFLFEDEVKPDEVKKVQFINHVTTYVTRDKANIEALKTTGKGFEFKFKIHPNTLSVKSGLEFIALIDGKPASDINFDVLQKDHDKPAQSVKSDNTGLVSISFKQAGIYVLNARVPSVNNGKIANPRYINWLIIEVMP